VIEHSKEGYYLALRQTQKTIHSDKPDWQPWLIFFLRALQQQKRRLADKIERERVILAALPTLSLQIMDQVRAKGRTNLSEMTALTNASRNTLKVHFRTLVEEKLLVREGAGRATWYRLS
jgi:Fic family protein